MSDRHPDIDIATTDELAVMAAGGDSHAFARLVRLHGEGMTRAAWLVTGHQPAAVEAVRSAWLTAWTGIRKPHEPVALGAWLCRLATMEAERIVHMAVEGVLPPGWPDWDGESATDLGRLAPADRSLLALHHLAGLTPEELDRITSGGLRARASMLLARRDTESAAQRLVRAWSTLGLDAADAPERICSIAAITAWPIDSDAIARGARFEERETRLRLVGAAIGVGAGLIVAMAPLLAGLSGGGR